MIARPSPRDSTARWQTYAHFLEAEIERLRAAIDSDGRLIADLVRQLSASDQAIRDHFDREGS